MLEQTSDFPWKSNFWFTSLGSANKAQVIDPQTPLFPIPSNSTFKLPGFGAPKDLNTTSTAYPTLLLRLAFFVKTVDIDLVSANSSNDTLHISPFSKDLTHRPSGFNRCNSLPSLDRADGRRHLGLSRHVLLQGLCGQAMVSSKGMCDYGAFLLELPLDARNHSIFERS